MRIEYLFLGFSTIFLAVLPAQAELTDDLRPISDVLNEADTEKVSLGIPSNDSNEVKVVAKNAETPAEIFTPYLEQIRNSLPSSLSMRLPSQVPVNDFSEEHINEYQVKINSFFSSPSLTVNLYNCDTDSPSCLVGSFSVDSKTSVTVRQAFKQFQATAIIIHLTDNIQGYLLEGKQQNPPQSLSSIMWEQDGAIYTASFREQEHQHLLSMVHSMAQSKPIQPTITLPNSPTIEKPQQLPVNAESEDENFVSKLPEDWKNMAQSEPIKPTITLPTSPTIESNQQLAVDAESEDKDFVPPLPPLEKFKIDKSGGEFPIGVIRRIAPLELQIGSSIFTNSNIGAASTTQDTSYVNGITLQGKPALGPSTRLASSIGGGFVRFDGGDGYDSLVTNLGVLQELDTNMSLGLGWRYRQLYAQGNQLNDLSEHSVVLSWNRDDQLDRNLFLLSGYQFQANFAVNDEQSRITNSLRLSLGYSFTPELIGLVGYRFHYDSFTAQTSPSFSGARNQLGTQIVYQINSELFIAASVSYLFGDSYDLLRLQRRALNNVSVGFHVGLNIPFFF